ncbi:hypothetical protein PG995_005070 [Apiospora arundinis]|uniref:Cell wall protein PhiA n=1 Tax=Apiospora arundinis TaxID=335852 RepID=A0ABR2I8B2_9PEZI
MQFKNIAITAASAAAVSAQTSNGQQVFGVLSIASGTPLQYAGWSASQRGLFNHGAAQQASCDKGLAQEFATFQLTDAGELYLYSTSNPRQQVFVDRSGMGQGIIGYTTGVEPTPRNAERTGFSVEDGHLKFDGNDFQACPGYAEGSYKVWLAGTTNPGGNSNCTAVAARIQTISEPVGCLYQQQ